VSLISKRGAKGGVKEEEKREEWSRNEIVKRKGAESWLR
jgi:hypothetical protein